jgi:hypothetical protein
LLRRVEAYLKDHALTNLTEADQIYVKGPEYIEASVLARVVPTDPSQADDVELAVLEQLETFLHPLWGGPQRAGWELGRDVYISEIYTEIEAVPGVDHVAQVRLSGSLQQVRLHLALGGFRQIHFDVAIGSQVSTFDERIKLLLAEPLPEGEGLTRLSVYGFKAGDRVAVVAADNTPIRDNLTISAISGSSVVFVQSFSPPTNWARRRALLSSDERVRLPLLPDGVMIDPEGRVAGVTVSGFRSGDQVSVVSGGYRHPELEFLPVERIEPCEDRIFVPEGHLIYSGTHDIEIALE